MNRLILCLLIFITSCGNKSSSPKFQRVEAANFNKFVNQKELSPDPNLNLDKVIVNNDYPIEIALYKDNQFYYNLPNLGDGKGTWVYKNGFLKLTASRKIFDMVIEVHSIDETAQQLAIKFSDRFGPNVLRVQNENIDQHP